MRTTFVVSDANYKYLQSHAIGDKGVSRLLNEIIQAHRVLGPLHERMQKQADRLDAIGMKFNHIAFQTTGDSTAWGQAFPELKGEISK